MERIVRIGVFGLGVIGSRVLSMITEQKEYLLSEYGIRLELGAILVNDIHKPRDINVDGLKLTVDENDILNDENISVCFECMGGSGAEYTKELVLRAITKKKNVIMSSKKCLAEYSREIFDSALRNHCQIRFEATVGGGIPICSVLNSMAKGEEITGIYGILNATSNYILSELNSDTMLYEEAVRKAKNLGYAENDPSEDVDGWDAAYKLNILMNIGMGTYCDISDFQPDTIKQIGPDDIQSAKENDEVIKQIAYVKKINNGGFTYFIGPCRIKKDNFLSNVNGNNNIIFVEGKSSGIRAFYGQGAGAGPTASVMFDDFINLLQYNYVFHNPDYCNHIIKERISPEMFI